jgi:hypothetical protein
MQSASVEIDRVRRGALQDVELGCEQRPYRGVSISPTSWSPDGPLTLLEWSQSGRRLGVIGRATGWWIGDWLNYGNTKFGERYVRAARITGYDVQTLMNMVYVASRFEPARRHDGLSWSHHAELAALEPADQDRWLERAAAERLSVRCLREEVRRARRLKEAEEDAAPAEDSEAEDELVCPHCGGHFNSAG